MMNRLLTLVGVLAAVATTLSASATAAERPPGPKQQQETTGYTVTYEDVAGNPVTRRSGSGEFQIDPGGGGGGGAGCTSVDAWRRSSTLFGNTAYVFHQVKHWCWSYPHITSVSVGTYFSDVDPNYLVGSTWGHGWYYGWAGAGTGGHYSLRQARVDNCVFHYGCLRTEYPWVEIWVNGNGAWAYNTGS